MVIKMHSFSHAQHFFKKTLHAFISVLSCGYQEVPEAEFNHFSSVTAEDTYREPSLRHYLEDNTLDLLAEETENQEKRRRTDRGEARKAALVEAPCFRIVRATKLDSKTTKLKIGKNKGVQNKGDPDRDSEFANMSSLPIKNMSRTEGAKQESLQDGKEGSDCGLHRILIKKMHRLGKEKIQAFKGKEVHRVQKQGRTNTSSWESLDKEHRLETEKVLMRYQSRARLRSSVARKEAIVKELQETWGGLSLDKVLVKPSHACQQLQEEEEQRRQAEEEERRQVEEEEEEERRQAEEEERRQAEEEEEEERRQERRQAEEEERRQAAAAVLEIWKYI